MIQQVKKNLRQEKILLRLDKFNFLTRKQLQAMEDLAGDRNAHRILNDMEKDKLLLSYRMEQKVYYMSNRGKERIGSNQGDLKKGQIKHTLMRNDLYIKLGMPIDWRNEKPSTWGDNRIVPDATFKRNGEFYFVEVDNLQTMRTNIDKIKMYKDLGTAVFNQFKHHPTVIWYTLSETRKEKLESECRRIGVKYWIG